MHPIPSFLISDQILWYMREQIPAIRVDENLSYASRHHLPNRLCCFLWWLVHCEWILHARSNAWWALVQFVSRSFQLSLCILQELFWWFHHPWQFLLPLVRMESGDGRDIPNSIARFDALIHTVHLIIYYHQKGFLAVGGKVEQPLHKIDLVQQRLIWRLPLAITPDDFSGNGCDHVFHMSDESIDKLSFSWLGGSCDDTSKRMVPARIHPDHWWKRSPLGLFKDSHDLVGESAALCEPAWRVPTCLLACFDPGYRDGGWRIWGRVLSSSRCRVST